MEINLIDTIKEDCKYYERLVNQDAMFESYMYLNECENSDDSGIYQLILNGSELWFGTLIEINAVVKSMVYLIEHKDRFDPAH